MSMVISGDNGLTFPAGSTQVQAGNFQTMVNRIINGRMEIDQRNAGAAVTANGAFPVDRFFVNNGTDGAFSAQQDSSAPAGFVNSTKITITTADTSLAATQNLAFVQRIEGTNISDLAWGTVNAKTVTLSFWVRSSLTGTFGGALRNNDANRSYPFTYSISVADTWEYKTVTIAGDTSGTWLTTTGVGINVFFGLGAGTDRSGTAGAWNSDSDVSANGAVSVVGTLNATWYVTGVDLRVGSYTVVPQDFRAYGTELALCQRYYQVIATGSAKAIGMATYYTSSNLSGIINWFVPMRTDPTFSQVTGTNYYRGQGNAATDDFNSFNVDRASPQMMMWYNTSEVSGTQGTASVVYTVNNASFLAVQAEL